MLHLRKPSAALTVSPSALVLLAGILKKVCANYNGVLARYGGGNLAALSAEPNRLFGHAHVVEDMIAAVRDGRNPEVMPAEALKSVRIVHAVYESARTGKTVML